MHFSQASVTQELMLNSAGKCISFAITILDYVTLYAIFFLCVHCMSNVLLQVAEGYYYYYY